jgi:hypothetical protein
MGLIALPSEAHLGWDLFEIGRFYKVFMFKVCSRSLGGERGNRRLILSPEAAMRLRRMLGNVDEACFWGVRRM